MRASVAHGTTASGSSSTALARRLTQKEMELQGVIALREVTTQYIAQLEGMCQDIEVSADAAVALGKVLEQWPQMFSTLGMLVKAQQDLAERMDEHTLAKNPVGETLVRFPIEDLQVVTDPSAERMG